MRSPPAPIRFLLTVIGGWAGFRIALLAPPWDEGPAMKVIPFPPAAKPPTAETPSKAATLLVTSSRSLRTKPRGARLVFEHFEAGAPGAHAQRLTLAPLPAPRPSFPLGANETTAPASAPESSSIGPAVRPAIAIPPAGRHSRWSVSAWLFARRGRSETGLIPAGTLAGSQAGARAAYRLTGTPGEGLSLSLRLYAPLHDRRAAEGAAGLDWKPLRAVPLRLLAERRAKLGPDGRSAFDLVVYGGLDGLRLGALRLDVYGQAGIVGARRRDRFADGAARMTVPLGRFRLGAGAWAAAQPGGSRVDAGPHADLTLPTGAGFINVSADWRFRVAGSARPGSGPAVTLSTGF
ncbi:MAG: hypothetical protein QOJ94_1052 [Sphingomonadales bacterium]|jgi:hypothetical protein|nr:hypothetical protein [Sphingomonadales bacterium]